MAAIMFGISLCISIWTVHDFVIQRVTFIVTRKVHPTANGWMPTIRYILTSISWAIFYYLSH